MNFQTFSNRDKMYKRVALVNSKKLKDMPQIKIGCGRFCGLPFDCLMTDVMSGCLASNKVCYGNCTAAEFWKIKGYDFGKRVLNKFDKEFFIKCVKNLPNGQLWLRQGWISDCSFSQESWDLIAEISSLLNSFKIRLLIITKIHFIPKKSTLIKLANNNVEVRVSLSALDTEKEYKNRLKFLNMYRDLGGLSIPYIMSSKYKNEELNRNQLVLVNYVIENDFIAGEHPLRFDKGNEIIKDLEECGFSHIKFPNQYWFGRLFYNIPNFILPPPTHLKENYFLPTCYLSHLDMEHKIVGLDGNLPTFEQLSRDATQKTEGLMKHAAYVIQKY